MSEDQLKAFLESVKADEGIQEQLKASGDADAVVAIAKAAGFMISADALKKAQTEVSDEELEGVAGGGGGPNGGIIWSVDACGQVQNGHLLSDDGQYVG